MPECKGKRLSNSKCKSLPHNVQHLHSMSIHITTKPLHVIAFYLHQVMFKASKLKTWYRCLSCGFGEQYWESQWESAGQKGAQMNGQLGITAEQGMLEEVKQRKLRKYEHWKRRGEWISNIIERRGGTETASKTAIERNAHGSTRA